MSEDRLPPDEDADWDAPPPEDNLPDPGWASSDTTASDDGGEGDGDVLEQLLATIGDLASAQGDQGEALKALHGVIRAQQKSIDAVQSELEDLQAALAPAADGPYAWAELRGLEREMLWRRLYDWVTWLEDRYLRNLSPSRQGIPALHADWYRHPVAVEMLTSLMVAHFAAYREKAVAPSFALVDWHERALWPTFARMEQLGLFVREHEEKQWNGPELRGTRRDDERFVDWLSDDIEAHPEEQ